MAVLSVFCPRGDRHGTPRQLHFDFGSAPMALGKGEVDAAVLTPYSPYRRLVALMQGSDFAPLRRGFFLGDERLRDVTLIPWQPRHRVVGVGALPGARVSCFFAPTR